MDRLSDLPPPIPRLTAIIYPRLPSILSKLSVPDPPRACTRFQRSHEGRASRIYSEAGHGPDYRSSPTRAKVIS